MTKFEIQNVAPKRNEIAELCKGVHCVDLGESIQTHIFLQNFASIQPRTSPHKFVHLQHDGGDLHRGALLGGLDREHELRDALAHGRQAELGLIPAGLEEGNPVEVKDLFSIYLLAVKKRAQPRRRSQKRPC